MSTKMNRPAWPRRRALKAVASGLAGLAIGARAAFAQTKMDDASSSLVSRLYGNPQAPKRFSLWGSYTCVFTAQAFSTLAKIVQDSQGKVSLEWHHFPIHDPDPGLHVAALGFDGIKFWQFSYEVLAFIYRANGDHRLLTPEKLVELAKKAGGSEETLLAAYADQAKWKTVKNDFLAGKLLGILLTPGLFYDGYFLTPNGLPLDLAGFEKSLRDMVQKG